MGDVVYVLTTMFVEGGAMIRQHELYEATHPLVVAHPDWFSADLLAIAHRTPAWTVDPPKRGPGRPRKIETTEANIEVTA